VLPIAAVVPYRRSGLSWGRAAALAALAVALTVAGVACTLVYAFFVTVDASQCGKTPVAAAVAALGAYVAVATWAMRRPRNVWAWAAAPLVAVAVVLLVGYFFAGAHAYCET
jgi:ABC-type Na+ efflux pump permease subunit